MTLHIFFHNDEHTVEVCKRCSGIIVLTKECVTAIITPIDML